MRDLSSSTKDQTYTHCIGRRSLNCWTTREVPGLTLKFVQEQRLSVKQPVHQVGR